jgi:hypothetical protein
MRMRMIHLIIKTLTYIIFGPKVKKNDTWWIITKEYISLDGEILFSACKYFGKEPEYFHTTYGTCKIKVIGPFENEKQVDTYLSILLKSDK